MKVSDLIGSRKEVFSITEETSVHQAAQYLREKQGETATLMSPHAVGLVMITIGLVGLILANWQERRAMKALRARCPELPQSISGVLAMLIALFGILALISVLLR